MGSEGVSGGLPVVWFCVKQVTYDNIWEGVVGHEAKKMAWALNMETLNSRV